MQPFNLFDSFSQFEIIKYDDFFDKLLPNIKLQILQYLDHKSLGALYQSCQKWRDFIRRSGADWIWTRTLLWKFERISNPLFSNLPVYSQVQIVSMRSLSKALLYPHPIILVSRVQIFAMYLLRIFTPT